MNTATTTHRWEATRARLTTSQTDDHTTPATEHDGWHIPYGPRPITVTYTDPTTGAVLGHDTWHHGQALRQVSNLLDHLAAHHPDGTHASTVALAVYEAIESDLATGTSIAAWPSWNALVDLVLSAAHQTSQVSTTWSEF
ncbi:hypothetical protein [Cellulosimicrobium cellulans]|uniref:hypothetical protein n=1 Tax=Cellulosimicrobium cellulans TaxID=1710 RepID=UPI0002DF4449|nr:hypothetical protein [Cellulosimicrobium cellulans]